MFPPALNSPVTWADSLSESIIVWGGWPSDIAKGLLPADEIWRFTYNHSDHDPNALVTPDGGIWYKETANRGALTSLSRPMGCAFTVLNGVGYCLGGSLWNQNDDSPIFDDVPSTQYLPWYAISGIVSLDFATKTFKNASSAGFGKYGTLNKAQAEPIPFGPNDLILFLGGRQNPVGTYMSEATLVDFSTLYFYDPLGTYPDTDDS